MQEDLKILAKLMQNAINLIIKENDESSHIILDNLPKPSISGVGGKNND